MYSGFDQSNYSSLFNVILILLIFILIRYIKEEKVTVIENYFSKLWLIISIVLLFLLALF